MMQMLPQMKTGIFLYKLNKSIKLSFYYFYIHSITENMDIEQG